jgi:hypothetical protein
MHPVLSVLLDHGLELVGTLLLIAAAPLMHALYRKVEAWTGIKIDDAERARLEMIVYDGIAKAEQWARVRAKSGTPTAGAEKLDHALDFITEASKSAGVKDLARERLVGLIEAKLGQL